MSDPGQNAYWNIGAALAVLIALVLGFLILPERSRAFWPFAEAFSGNPAPIVHDSSLSLLRAATNADPNPAKGGGDITIVEGSALLADSGPSGTIADLEDPKSDRISLYVVRRGDSLSDIGKMFGVSVNTIVWANNLPSSRAIKEGDTLLILPVSGVKHTVLKNDTLVSIAKKYKSDANEIAIFNGLESNATLAVGYVLIIPGGEVDAPKSTNTNTPLRGTSGPSYAGYYTIPVAGSILTQGLHGWNGIDLGARYGTPIVAAASGTVIVSRASGWNGGYGAYVVVTHANGTQTLYSHMSRDIVSVGQEVARGEVIGYVGQTGRATGPHLHFEVRGAKNPFASCVSGAICR